MTREQCCNLVILVYVQSCSLRLPTVVLVFQTKHREQKWVIYFFSSNPLSVFTKTLADHFRLIIPFFSAKFQHLLSNVCCWICCPVQLVVTVSVNKNLITNWKQDEVIFVPTVWCSIYKLKFKSKTKVQSPPNPSPFLSSLSLLALFFSSLFHLSLILIQLYLSLSLGSN